MRVRDTSYCGTIIIAARSYTARERSTVAGLALGSLSRLLLNRTLGVGPVHRSLVCINLPARSDEAKALVAQQPGERDESRRS